jgi:hypothetical protein
MTLMGTKENSVSQSVSRDIRENTRLQKLFKEFDEIKKLFI